MESVLLLQFFTSVRAPSLIVDLVMKLNSLHFWSGDQEEAVQFASVLQAWKHSPLLLAGKEGWDELFLKNFRRLQNSTVPCLSQPGPVVLCPHIYILLLKYNLEKSKLFTWRPISSSKITILYLSHYLHLNWVFDKTCKEKKVCFTTDQLIEELSSAVTDPEVCTIERIELVQLVEQITSFVYQMINPANTSIIILASFLTRFACIFHFWRLHTTSLNYLVFAVVLFYHYVPQKISIRKFSIAMIYKNFN